MCRTASSFLREGVCFINHRNIESVQIVFQIHSRDTPRHTYLQISSNDRAKKCAAKFCTRLTNITLQLLKLVSHACGTQQK
jgi:hypothetical protein